MSAIRDELVIAAYERAEVLIDYIRNIHNDIDKRHEFRKQTILADKSLTEDEKSEAIKLLNEIYDENKILYKKGKKRICENCQEECLATLYCEFCIRNNLKVKFSNWTSGNNGVDDLIQKCQMKTLKPDRIVEWISYNNLQNIKYLTKGGCSEIYTADWVDGQYYGWDSIKRQLKRYGTRKIILKKLENVESANRSWFDEAKSHLTICIKWERIVQCFGLTQDPSNGDYMLVMRRLDINLRKYLQRNHDQLTWKERIKITVEIVDALLRIHNENAIHRDLHSGNILYYQCINSWFVSDLGLCGPADKPLGSIYGNLPYIAPEVIVEKKYTFASDIYSVAMLMWEISSGQPPFFNYENDYNLAMNIVNGFRPRIASGTPLKYKELMEQCWDADRTKRPNVNILFSKIDDIYKSYHTSRSANITNSFQSFQLKTNNLKPDETSSSKLFTSKIYRFDNLPKPKNATEEEQEVFHSRPYSFNIPENINDFNKSNNQSNNNSTSKTHSTFRDSKKLFKVFQKLQVNSGNSEIAQQQVRKQDVKRIYDDDNLHSEPVKLVKLEIPYDYN